MARSKAQQTHAKLARERARLEKRVRKQEKKDVRKQAIASGDDKHDEQDESASARTTATP